MVRVKGLMCQLIWMWSLTVKMEWKSYRKMKTHYRLLQRYSPIIWAKTHPWVEWTHLILLRGHYLLLGHKKYWNMKILNFLNPLNLLLNKLTIYLHNWSSLINFLKKSNHHNKNWITQIWLIKSNYSAR